MTTRKLTYFAGKRSAIKTLGILSDEDRNSACRLRKLLDNPGTFYGNKN